MTTRHYTADRSAREQFIQSIGEGKVILKKVVDKGHPNGAEIHCITDNGIIIVYNERTKRLVTKLIARPAQLQRYFKVVPKELYAKACEHQRLGYNLI